jgi:hypothetical protein
LKNVSIPPLGHPLPLVDDSKKSPLQARKKRNIYKLHIAAIVNTAIGVDCLPMGILPGPLLVLVQRRE